MFFDIKPMRLSSLKQGESAIITKILGHGAFRKRVLEMGFVKGRRVTAMLHAPLQDPVKYRLMDYEVSLRNSESSLIEVVPEQEWNENMIPTPGQEALTANNDDAEEAHPEAVRQDRVINVALLGNPNCGKTSLFNHASGAHEHVGNYAGVTVGAKEGWLKYKGYRINIIDLPGTYSLSSYSPEERYVNRYLYDQTPDVIINVVVASNLERNLYLTTELIDMNRSMVVALNMYDELQKNGVKLDHKHLGKMLGVPIVPTVASAGNGIDELLQTVVDVYEMNHPDVRHIHVNLGNDIEPSVKVLTDFIKSDHTIGYKFAPRYLAISLLGGNEEIEHLLSESKSFNELCHLRDKECDRIEKILHEDATTAIASRKYGFIQGALAETMPENVAGESKTTKIIDAFVTNKLFGFPIFFAAMLLMFWATFEIGAYPMQWIESLVALISDRLAACIPSGPLKDLLIDGILGGVGSVIVFLPNILILYTFISFMEDSGYMARVAFIMDKVMHKIGLHGKSFIPLVMGFGCNVPAVMSARIVESRSRRIITILLTPFMSCSARIPIYVLLVGTFFPRHGTWVFFGLYLLGIIMAVITAKLLIRFKYKEDEMPFVMELPPYRMPTFKATVSGMWMKARQYLKKMGGLILVASIIVWALSYFPAGGKVSEDITDATQTQCTTVQQQQADSYMGQLGHFLEPVMKPLGFNWKITVSLLAGGVAKEVVVSTLGVLYTGEDDNTDLLSERLQSVNPATGVSDFSIPVVLSFLVFVLIYFPCIATVVAISKECGSWKFGLFSILYNTSLAWLISFITYRLALLFV